MGTEIINDCFYFHFPYMFTLIKLLLSLGLIFFPPGLWRCLLLQASGRSWGRMVLLCRNIDCTWK